MEAQPMKLPISAIVLLCCLLSTATRAELPIDELALYMSFDDIQGNKVMDGSEHGNHGTIMKASVAENKGKYGNAMEFKGGDNHVLIKNAESLSISDEVTISAWINWNDAPGDGWLSELERCPWQRLAVCDRKRDARRTLGELRTLCQPWESLLLLYALCRWRRST
jgi:hypothetical protein